MKGNKQRLIVIASMTVLLVAAAILNHKLNSTIDPAPVLNQQATQGNTLNVTDPVIDTAAAAQTGKFFSEYKEDRDKKRGDEATYLDSVLSDDTTDAATRAEAQKMKLELASALEKELSIETLLKAKGFSDVAAIFHTGAVNIVVGKAQLSQAEVAQILDIVKKESGETADNIKIIPVQ